MRRAEIGLTAGLAACSVALGYLIRRITRREARALDERLTAKIGVRERSADRLAVFAEPRWVALEALALASIPRLRARERFVIVAAPLAAGVVGHLLKWMLPRERPAKTRFAPNGDQSFPSTHTAYATSLALAATHVACCHGAHAWTYALGVPVAVWIGLDRVRGAAHWPTDVMAGGLVGAASVCATRLAAMS